MNGDSSRHRWSAIAAHAGAALVFAALVVGCPTGADDLPPPPDNDSGIVTGPPCGRLTTACGPGKSCQGPPDCMSMICRDNVCHDANPPNGQKDGDETDVDCGGSSAPACGDNKGCLIAADCTSSVCTGMLCQPPSPTDGVRNGDETGTDCGGAKAPKCPPGQGCLSNADCDKVKCDTIQKVCLPPAHDDGIKNLDETGIDCGGPTMSVKRCPTGETCVATSDCDNVICNAMTKVCDPPTPTDGLKNGTETDVDCGGGAPTNAPRCLIDQKCALGTDCKSGGCSAGLGNKCTLLSCATAEVAGISSCGAKETGDPAAVHESCCKSLVLPTRTTRRLDKYEITAGRMRAFLEAIGGGVDAAGNAKDPNVKAYMAAHKPATRWNPGWENVLPADNTTSTATYVVKDTTTDFAYPGQDQYLLNHWTQNTWWIRATGPNDTAMQTAGQQGTYTVATSLFYVLNAGTMMPEYYANPADWPPPIEGEGYAVAHALNCSNQRGSFGWSTYWFDDATINTYGGDNGVGKFPGSKDLLDEKAMNCSPNALFAAFCAWDGGQIADADVIDAITGNTASPIYDAGNNGCLGGAACQGGKLAVGKSTNCAPIPGSNPVVYSLNVFGDGTQGCYSVFPYTTNSTAGGRMFNTDYDDTGKIAAPGRVLADVITKAAGDEPWMDLIGNLQEAVIKKADPAIPTRFDYRGYGVEWSSIQHHHNQQTTPRFKGGAFGARCMRFK